jgi:hypothetical protein
LLFQRENGRGSKGQINSSLHDFTNEMKYSKE